MVTPIAAKASASLTATTSEPKPDAATRLLSSSSSIDEVKRRSDGSYEAKLSSYPDKGKVIVTPDRTQRDAPPKAEVVMEDGTRRELTLDEKKLFAQQLDRRVSNGDLKGESRSAANGAMDQLLKETFVEAKWDTPNRKLDRLFGDGKVDGVERTNGTALGSKTGPMQVLSMSDGQSERDVIYERGDGTRPIFSKTVKGEYDHQVKLTKEEAEQLRRNLAAQGPLAGESRRDHQQRLRDLDRYIAAEDTYGQNERFARGRLLAVA